MEKEKFLSIVSQFDIPGTVVDIKPLGNGLINDTFKVTTQENNCPDYVLQHINNAIFTDVDMLMHNIVAVTTHIRKKLEEKGETDINRKVLNFRPAKQSGKYYFCDENGKYWRIISCHAVGFA